MSDRWMTITIILAVFVGVGTLVYRAYLGEDEVAETVVVESNEVEGVPRVTRVYANLTDCSRLSGGQTRAIGYIRNTGNVDLHHVKVNVLWLNKLDQLVEANEVYALTNEALVPGDTKEFMNVTQKLSALRCNVEAIDWW